jgi:hypothetical protein
MSVAIFKIEHRKSKKPSWHTGGSGVRLRIDRKQANQKNRRVKDMKVEEYWLSDNDPYAWMVSSGIVSAGVSIKAFKKMFSGFLPVFSKS